MTTRPSKRASSTSVRRRFEPSFPSTTCLRRAAATADPNVAAWIHEKQGGHEIDVLAVPRAARSRVVGLHGDRLRIQLAAPPADGAANRALLDILAEQLGIRKTSLTLISGHGSRAKRVRIEGLTTAEIERKLTA
ncbi:MAG: DUF167 domain-containing protein [Deltaproteobacteria bacterium]|nr:DUF167 domain-containing protein [Deltaproteobacteria bacterium]